MFLSANHSPRAKIQQFLEHFQMSLPPALWNLTFTQTWKPLILAASTARVLEGASVLKRTGERTKKQNKNLDWRGVEPASSEVVTGLQHGAELYIRRMVDLNANLKTVKFSSIHSVGSWIELWFWKQEREWKKNQLT